MVCRRSEAEGSMMLFLCVLVQLMVVAHVSGVVKSRTSLVVFTSNLKRLHDNPLLHHVANSGAKALPVAVLDASQEGEYPLLSTSLASYGGKLVQRFDSYGQLAAFVKEQASSIDEVVICPSPLLLQEEKEHLAHASASARLVTLDDSLLPELQLAGKASNSFSDYKDLYDAAVQQLVATAEKGNDLLAPPLQLAFASQACCDAASTMATTPEETGEARALALVREYLSMGDDAFSLKPLRVAKCFVDFLFLANSKPSTKGTMVGPLSSCNTKATSNARSSLLAVRFRPLRACLHQQQRKLLIHQC